MEQSHLLNRAWCREGGASQAVAPTTRSFILPQRHEPSCLVGLLKHQTLQTHGLEACPWTHVHVALRPLVPTVYLRVPRHLPKSHEKGREEGTLRAKPKRPPWAVSSLLSNPKHAPKRTAIHNPPRLVQCAGKQRQNSRQVFLLARSGPPSQCSNGLAQSGGRGGAQLVMNITNADGTPLLCTTKR